MTDLSLVEEHAWQLAKRRAEIIRPLAALRQCPHPLVRAAASELDLSERQVYALIRRCRAMDGAALSLVPGVSGGGKGRSRLTKAQEELLGSVIAEVYLTPQRIAVQALIREIRRRFRLAGLSPPSGSTVRRRTAALSPQERGRRGEKAPLTEEVSGRTPSASYPLAAVQMDHTKVDVILVDPWERQPIGRPWLTVAIDLFSRCIVGMHLSLEAPSATSVGLCLVHAASDKTAWLAERNIGGEWPIQGKPGLISVDNGAEFHSAAFERGCEQHGIAIQWRPPGQPHYGGIVERVIGSLMKLVHELPGTTFSNPGERNAYDSDATACLTLDELEHWMAITITGVYHSRPHAGLGGKTPLSVYRGFMERPTAGSGQSPATVRNPRAFLIDFLPVFRRTVQRHGVTLDHITYFSPALSPWIARRAEKEPLLIRRDPRNLSRIYVFDPGTRGYLEIPYRDISHPAISLWEHRLALRRLRERSRSEIDEAALFHAVAELRSIEQTAARTTRTARRNRTRRHHQDVALLSAIEATPDSIESIPDDMTDASAPFDEIEEW